MNPSNAIQGTETTSDPTQTPGSDFSFGDFDFSNAGQAAKAVQQPRWKFSFDGQHLNIWPVDTKYGQPHHIEITGMDFYKLAQGRVYVDPDGYVEMLMWKDRGTPEMRDACVNAVDDWLESAIGKIADQVTYQTEGGYTYDQDQDLDKMMTTYFGYPVKMKPDGTHTRT